MEAASIQHGPPHRHTPATRRMVLAHIWLMLFSWALAVPVAIGIAVLGRKYKWTWWGKAHMAIMTFGVTLPMTIAAILGFVASNGIRLRTHLILGTVVTVLAWLQISLGVVNHLIYRRRASRNQLPAKRPWHNVIHIWLGRLLGVAALITIVFGMQLRHTTQPWYIGYAVYIVVLLSIASALYFRAVRQSIIESRLPGKQDIPPEEIEKEI